MKRTTEDGYSRTNREMSLEPTTTHSGWCDGCDEARVFPGKKCPNCGHRQDPLREKKPVVRE